MRSSAKLFASLLAMVALGSPAVAPAAAAEGTVVFKDSRTDVPTGVGLSRVGVHNGDNLVVTTHHRDLRRRGYGTGFTVWVDTGTSHRGPDYVILGGLADGTDYKTGRATRRWHTRIKAFDDIWSCAKDLDVSYKTDTVRITLSRDCLGGHQGRVRVAVEVSDENYTDWGPAPKTFSRWVARG
jgi:hypothetical protein